MTSGIPNSGYFKAVVYAFIGAVICIGIVAFSDGASRINSTYPHFLLYPNRVVNELQPLSFHGAGLGVRYPDIITKVNGKEVSNGAEVYGIVARMEPGTPVTYSISRLGKEMDAVIPSASFTPMDFLTTAGAMTGAGLAAMLVGVIFLNLKGRTKASTIFTIIFLCTGGLAGLNFNFSFTYYAPRLLPFFVCSISMLGLWLWLYFPEERRLAGRAGRLI
jgi:hypothetical protein